MIRKIGATFFLGVFLVTPSGCSRVAEESSTRQGPADLPYAEELQIALDQALEHGRGEYDVGLSAAVVAPGYKPWVGVSGDSHAGVPVTTDMLFNMGSIAKSFEAALALKLAERGALDLDRPISTWLPPHARVDGRITIRQLLNHSSGVFNVFEHPDFPWLGPEVDYGRAWRLEEVFDRFVGEPYGPPGYAQHYSSTNYLLLTKILEQILEDSSVPDEVERLFLEPLELNHTFMSMGDLPPSTFAVVHPWVDIDSDNVLDDFSGKPQTWVSTMTHPVLYATPEDIARWMLALLHEKRVLSEASLQEMLTLPETALRDPEGGRYGLGIVEFTKIDETRVIGHAGSSLGYTAAAFYLPEYGLSVVWAINTGENPLDLTNRLMANTWSSLYPVLSRHGKETP